MTKLSEMTEEQLQEAISAQVLCLQDSDVQSGTTEEFTADDLQTIIFASEHWLDDTVERSGGIEDIEEPAHHWHVRAKAKRLLDKIANEEAA